MKFSTKIQEGLNVYYTKINVAYINGQKKYIYGNEEHIYDLASLTKVVVTTTLILKLIEKKELSFDTKVQSILMRYRHQSTIGELLLHTSGLKADLNYKKCENESELLNLLYSSNLSEKKLIYSDLGFILLGKIIEAKYQMKLDEIAEKEIFLPLKMHDTYYRVPENKIDLCASVGDKEKRKNIKGVVHDGKTNLLNRVSGSAGVFSTVNDLILFLEALLNYKILKKSTVKLLSSFEKNNRTYGWMIKYYNKEKYLFHTGFTGTCILISLKSKKGIVILTNSIIYGNKVKLKYNDFKEDMIKDML